MFRTAFNLGLVGFEWNVDRPVIAEAALRAGRATQCVVKPIVLNGTEGSSRAVHGIIAASQTLCDEIPDHISTEVVSLLGLSWEESVEKTTNSMKSLIGSVAVRRLHSAV